ncbi:MAG TPA: ROK family protein [Candidatus Eisenbergiella merdipullorum]|uniref:ROK family protein n=1 Tax=Candidatus Eisenbergiella merdipullorum TaxID=2838553 RepID=A0A9D2I7W9_9FIRM|nr:ROK family protein [Candidatus Eisenbergiella merdipullorum]
MDSANAKDTLAIAVMDEFCTYISYALINMLDLLNISVLIIGYDSSGGGRVIKEMLRTKLSHSLQSVNYDNITVMHSSFNGDAPLIGSIAFAADKIFSLQEKL